MGIFGFIKKHKSQQPQQPPLPPGPPRPPTENSFSQEELSPPPKIVDFDEEIPELPELDIPEELGGVMPQKPDSIPQPVSESVPPPQGLSEEALSETDSPKESNEGKGLDDIKFQKTEKPKLQPPVETTPSKPSVPITFFKEKKLFVNDTTYGEIVKRLDNISDTVLKSPHSKRIQEIDGLKEEAINSFKEEVKAIFQILDQVDSIAFKR